MRAVAEAATAQDAIDLWQPGPTQTAPLKRLQPKAKTVDIAADVVVAPAAEAAQAVVDAGTTIVNSGIHYHTFK